MKPQICAYCKHFFQFQPLITAGRCTKSGKEVEGRDKCVVVAFEEGKK